MIKKIPVTQLRVGMYIHDLNCSWIRHSFLFHRFSVKDEGTLRKILDSGIAEIFIDTNKGLDVEPPPPPPPPPSVPEAATSTPPSESPGEEKEPPQSEEPTQPEAPAILRAFKTQPMAPLTSEMGRAREIHNQAVTVVRGILHDVRLGKQVEMERVEPVVEAITESIFRNADALISLSRIKQKDDYTFLHCVSVCALLVAFARNLQLEQPEIQQLGIGGLIHDIGKMLVPDEILNKPGRLTPEEFEIMKSHVARGHEVLIQSPNFPDPSVMVMAQHHERFDGTGYPARLSQSQISQYGQMAAIVDVYDAITSNRVYHTAMLPNDALKKLMEWSQTQFNPELVELFIKTIGIYPVGSLIRLESGYLAVVVEQRLDDLLHPKVRVVYDTRKGGRIPPRLLDLSWGSNIRGGDTIVGHESPEEWDINPILYLTEA